MLSYTSRLFSSLKTKRNKNSIQENFKSEFSNNYIKVHGSKIYYTKAGNPASPKLVFLHGWLTKDFLSKGLLEKLSEHFYVIAPEHPGQGRSEPLREYKNIFERYTDVLRSILETEKWHREKIIVMGQSFGGGIASRYARKYHKNVGKLVLVDSIMGGSNKKTWMKSMLKVSHKTFEMLPKMPAYMRRVILKHMFCTFENDALSWEQIDKSLPERMKMLESFTSINLDAMKENTLFLEHKYKGMEVIMIWGDKDGRWKDPAAYGITPLEDAIKIYGEMRRNGQNVKFKTVRGGHFVIYQNPAAIVDALLETLDEQ